MMNQPWLSVIMPTYNGAAFLAKTLASIARQADHQIEVIAVDDGSTDATLAILSDHLRRLPLHIIQRGRIGNWVANTNHGLAQAHGRYACFLHQDDLWLPGRLALLKKLVAKEPQAALLFHASRYIDTQGRWLGVWHSPLPTGRLVTEQVIEHLLVQNFIAVPAPIFARDAAINAGGLDEALWYTADWDFWLKLATRGPIVYHPRPLAAFRIHAESQTAQGIARAGEMRRQIETVLERHYPTWQAAHPTRADVGRAARMSLEVNYALAAFAFGDCPNWRALASDLAALGPAGWVRFFRSSRIVERVSAQVSARLDRSRNGTAIPWRSRSDAEVQKSPQFS
jgi:glycosyltransferase involved in cell wall biosynthesis